MGAGTRRGTIALVITAALVAAGVGVAPPVAAQDPVFGVTVDGTGDALHGEGDIHLVLDDYTDGTISLLFSTATATLLDGHAPWMDDDSYMYWTLHTDGDDSFDYWVVFGTFGPGDHFAQVRTPDNTTICEAPPAFGITTDGIGWFGTAIDASCIGSPSSLRYTVAVRYRDASRSSTTSFDRAPDTGWRTLERILEPEFDDPTAAGVEEQPPAAAPPTGDTAGSAAGPDAGYQMLGRDGRVWGFGPGASSSDSDWAAGTATAIELSPDGDGYWTLTEDGFVAAAGGAYRPSGDQIVDLEVGERATSMSATPTGQGYWVFTDRGRAIPRGDAEHFGDMGGRALNGPVIDSVATPSGRGYWMVASDGGVFSFGDATFRGSMGGQPLAGPVVGIVPDPDRVGYWLVADDGGMFAFDAPFRGSVPGALPAGASLNAPVVGAVAHGDGYLMVATDGGIFSFSDREFHGSLGASPPSTPIIDVASVPGVALASAGAEPGYTAAAHGYRWTGGNGRHWDSITYDRDGDGRLEYRWDDNDDNGYYEVVRYAHGDTGRWTHIWMDLDQNGRWEIIMYPRRSGAIEAYLDLDGNGRYELGGWDAGGDGYFEWFRYDTNRDGVADTWTVARNTARSVIDAVNTAVVSRPTGGYGQFATVIALAARTGRNVSSTGDWDRDGVNDLQDRFPTDRGRW